MFKFNFPFDPSKTRPPEPFVPSKPVSMLPSLPTSIPKSTAPRRTGATPPFFTGFARPPEELPPLPRRVAQLPNLITSPATPVPPSQPPPAKKPKPRRPKPGCELNNNDLRPHVLAEDRLRTWKSPHSIEHDLSFRNQLPKEAVEKTYAALLGAYAPNTQGNYGAGLLRFHQYCDTLDIAESARMPASYFLLASFIAHHMGTVGGGTVKSWMSGIKAWHDVNGAPWNGDDRWVELARRSANKEGSAFKRDQRGPVTEEHMWALHAGLNRTGSFFDAAVWSTATAAFWGCRRLGEVTVPSLAKYDPKYHVSRSAKHKRITPHASSSATAVPIPWTKSTRDRGAVMTLTDRDDELCPSKAFANHLRVNATVPPDAPLFAFESRTGNWSPMTKTWFLQRVAGIWEKAGLMGLFGHSFRIGGSTALLLAGVPCEIVAALGGWTSLAFLLYWRKIEHIIPMHIGKACDKNRLDNLAMAFEAFRVANKISLPSADEEL